MKCVDSKEVYRLFAGDLDRDRVVALESHFGHCESCAAMRAEVSIMADRLAPDSGEFDDPELTDEIMTLVHLGRAEREGSGQPWWAALQARWRSLVWLPVAVGATAALLFTVWPQTEPIESPGFQSRGAAENRDRWVSIQAFRAGDGSYDLVEDVMRVEDTLAFSYSNRATERYHYLMIFAVGENGQVFWYYPAHEDETQNPASIAIEVSDRLVDLPDQVRHDLDVGPLRVFGLFSEEPLDVNAIEAVVLDDLRAAGAVAALQRLRVEGSGQHSFLVDVRSSAEQR